MPPCHPLRPVTAASQRTGVRVVRICASAPVGGGSRFLGPATRRRAGGGHVPPVSESSPSRLRVASEYVTVAWHSLKHLSSAKKQNTSHAGSLVSLLPLTFFLLFFLRYLQISFPTFLSSILPAFMLSMTLTRRTNLVKVMEAGSSRRGEGGVLSRRVVSRRVFCTGSPKRSARAFSRKMARHSRMRSIGRRPGGPPASRNLSNLSGNGLAIHG
jgi:hypothetical protein